MNLDVPLFLDSPKYISLDCKAPHPPRAAVRQFSSSQAKLKQRTLEMHEMMDILILKWIIQARPGILNSQVVNAMSVHDMCMVHLLGITQDIFPIWM